MPTHPFFGREDDSYNIDDVRNSNVTGSTSDGTGRPGMSIVSNAIQFWVGQRQGGERATVGEVARVFNMPAEAVAECVIEAPWMLLEGDADGPLADMRIELEGE